MKTPVLDFIDSDTLREHLSNQTLEPAIECILIVHSRKCSIQKKIEALKELAVVIGCANSVNDVTGTTVVEVLQFITKNYPKS